ncbi:hypothetical protein AVEN_31851-1 [Araneus ventricosus]|uniref:Uncharacterized protein n=1 Tax=Araneus ventricosus TaxID=182803 RepID=A0A4Y2F616_ARAVE|nr:hypothetical protein AVEN_31851-1 [Araneus ventricosus]
MFTETLFNLSNIQITKAILFEVFLDSDFDECFLDAIVALINSSLFCSPSVSLEASMTSFRIRSSACVCEGNLIKSQPSIGHRPVSSSEVPENWRRCHITSLPVNEIYVVSSS